MLVLLVCGAQAAGGEEADSELRAVVASLRSKVAELEMNQQAAGLMLVQQMHSTKVKMGSHVDVCVVLFVGCCFLVFSLLPICPPVFCVVCVVCFFFVAHLFSGGCVCVKFLCA